MVVHHLHLPRLYAPSWLCVSLTILKAKMSVFYEEKKIFNLSDPVR